MSIFSGLKISNKMLIFSIFIILVSIISVSFFSISMVESWAEKDIENLKTEEINKRKAVLSNYVDIAWAGINKNYLNTKDDDYLSTNPDFSEEEAKMMSMEFVKTMRWLDGKGYLWINDMARPFPNMVMHPAAPTLDGKVLNNPKYNCAMGNNQNLFVAAVDVCQKDGKGFVDYLWPKASKDGLSKKNQPKLSFVKKFEPWNWVIGTGIYIDDVDKMIEVQKERIEEHISSLISTILLVGIILLVVITIITVLFAKGINKSILFVNESISEISESINNGVLNNTMDEDSVSIDFYDSAVNINQMIASFIKPLEMTTEYLNKIASGVIPNKISENYKGDFNNIKNNLNSLIDVNTKIEDTRNKEKEIKKYQDNEAFKLKVVLDAMSQSDLSKYYTPENGTDDTKEVSNVFNGISQALNGCLDSLSEVIDKVKTGAVQVNSAAGQVSSAAQSLSTGASNQAASLEEITSSVTEISSQTNTNSQNAEQANILSLESRNNAKVGNSQMKDLILAMKDINESSSSISKVVKTIDDIAFQINLLSLNAAVEAARAGKHGKGFAVVADEVKNLAGRSAKASRETASLIEDSVKRVNAGTKIVDNTAEALEKIENGSTKVTDLVGEISSASNEQATGVAEISTGLGEVSNVTQQIAANAEETAATAEEMSSQAVELESVVNGFKLNSNHNSKNGRALTFTDDRKAITMGK